MGQRLSAATVVPHGFVVERVDEGDADTEVLIRSAALASLCPACGGRTARVHSRYRRRLGDLPLAGRPLRLTLLARRFRCGTRAFQRRIFAERFEGGAVLPWARRTARLDMLVVQLGLALGGRPAHASPAGS